MILLLSNYYPGDLIMNEKGGTCGMYEGRGEMHTGVCWEHLKKRDSLKQLMLNGRIILTLIFKKCLEAVDWIYMPQCSDMRWWALAYRVMKICVP